MTEAEKQQIIGIFICGVILLLVLLFQLMRGGWPSNIVSSKALLP